MKRSDHLCSHPGAGTRAGRGVDYVGRTGPQGHWTGAQSSIGWRRNCQGRDEGSRCFLSFKSLLPKLEPLADNDASAPRNAAGGVSTVVLLPMMKSLFSGVTGGGNHGRRSMISGSRQMVSSAKGRFTSSACRCFKISRMLFPELMLGSKVWAMQPEA
ncbi:hypothetical protein CEXT_772711 [Caerostris extrusa]|uniref:Uncharacterized protein n=1 Tax=Caerostris extrusa TaxID=172846 RepID=A0AAV4UER5_CAEEX|nr:hypothetical protein CEXT_772711 [Caerostris extrusa]